jgi:hypothetical protein
MNNMKTSGARGDCLARRDAGARRDDRPERPRDIVAADKSAARPSERLNRMTARRLDCCRLATKRTDPDEHQGFTSGDAHEPALLALFRRSPAGPVRAITVAPAIALLATGPLGRRDARSTERLLLPADLHYAYAGDTPLHLAAAGYQTALAEELVSKGANVSARNRRGAEPLRIRGRRGSGLRP